MTPPLTNLLTNRSDSDYAIEFGEYLAKATEELLVEINMQYNGTGDEIDQDLWGNVYAAIYEFRKRARKVPTAWLGHMPHTLSNPLTNRPDPDLAASRGSRSAGEWAASGLCAICALVMIYVWGWG